MENRILFIVFQGEIKFLQNTTMDHREWFLSLGGSMDEYDNVIRGYIMEGMMIFFKANLNYDTEVIDFAIKNAMKIRNMLNNQSLKVCCGINPGHDGTKWEPILILNDKDLEGYQSEEELLAIKQEEEKQKEVERKESEEEQLPILEFKNNEDDPEFIAQATSFTVTLLVLAGILKVILVLTKKMLLGSRWNVLLLLGQMISFILTIIGYKKKMANTKYFALAASVFSFIMFDLGDLIIGALNFLFTIDQTYIKKLAEFSKATKKKIEEFLSKIKEKKRNV